MVNDWTLGRIARADLVGWRTDAMNRGMRMPQRRSWRLRHIDGHGKSRRSTTTKLDSRDQTYVLELIRLCDAEGSAQIYYVYWDEAALPDEMLPVPMPLSR